MTRKHIMFKNLIILLVLIVGILLSMLGGFISFKGQKVKAAGNGENFSTDGEIVVNVNSSGSPVVHYTAPQLYLAATGETASNDSFVAFSSDTNDICRVYDSSAATISTSSGTSVSVTPTRVGLSFFKVKFSSKIGNPSYEGHMIKVRVVANLYTSMPTSHSFSDNDSEKQYALTYGARTYVDLLTPATGTAVDGLVCLENIMKTIFNIRSTEKLDYDYKGIFINRVSTTVEGVTIKQPINSGKDGSDSSIRKMGFEVFVDATVNRNVIPIQIELKEDNSSMSNSREITINFRAVVSASKAMPQLKGITSLRQVFNGTTAVTLELDKLFDNLNGAVVTLDNTDLSGKYSENIVGVTLIPENNSVQKILIEPKANGYTTIEMNLRCMRGSNSDTFSVALPIEVNGIYPMGKFVAAGSKGKSYSVFDEVFSGVGKDGYIFDSVVSVENENIIKAKIDKGQLVLIPLLAKGETSCVVKLINPNSMDIETSQILLTLSVEIGNGGLFAGMTTFGTTMLFVVIGLVALVLLMVIISIIRKRKKHRQMKAKFDVIADSKLQYKRANQEMQMQQQMNAVPRGGMGQGGSQMQQLGAVGSQQMQLNGGYGAQPQNVAMLNAGQPQMHRPGGGMYPPQRQGQNFGQQGQRPGMYPPQQQRPMQRPGGGMYPPQQQNQGQNSKVLGINESYQQNAVKNNLDMNQINKNAEMEANRFIKEVQEKAVFNSQIAEKDRIIEMQKQQSEKIANVQMDLINKQKEQMEEMLKLQVEKIEIERKKMQDEIEEKAKNSESAEAVKHREILEQELDKVRKTATEKIYCEMKFEEVEKRNDNLMDYMKLLACCDKLLAAKDCSKDMYVKQLEQTEQTLSNLEDVGDIETCKNEIEKLNNNINQIQADINAIETQAETFNAGKKVQKEVIDGILNECGFVDLKQKFAEDKTVLSKQIEADYNQFNDKYQKMIVSGDNETIVMEISNEIQGLIKTIKEVRPSETAVRLKEIVEQILLEAENVVTNIDLAKVEGKVDGYQTALNIDDKTNEIGMIIDDIILMISNHKVRMGGNDSLSSVNDIKTSTDMQYITAVEEIKAEATECDNLSDILVVKGKFDGYVNAIPLKEKTPNIISTISNAKLFINQLVNNLQEVERNKKDIEDIEKQDQARRDRDNQEKKEKEILAQQVVDMTIKATQLNDSWIDYARKLNEVAKNMFVSNISIEKMNEKTQEMQTEDEVLDLELIQEKNEKIEKLNSEIEKYNEQLQELKNTENTLVQERDAIDKDFISVIEKYSLADCNKDCNFARELARRDIATDYTTFITDYKNDMSRKDVIGEAEKIRLAMQEEIGKVKKDAFDTLMKSKLEKLSVLMTNVEECETLEKLSKNEILVNEFELALETEQRTPEILDNLGNLKNRIVIKRDELHEKEKQEQVQQRNEKEEQEKLLAQKDAETADKLKEMQDKLKEEIKAKDVMSEERKAKIKKASIQLGEIHLKVPNIKSREDVVKLEAELNALVETFDDDVRVEVINVKTDKVKDAIRYAGEVAELRNKKPVKKVVRNVVNRVVERQGAPRPAGARPTGARPAQPGTRPAGARPAQPGTRPAGAKPPIGTKPAQPGARPVGARPAQSGARPVGARPAQPGARPVGARPAQPGARPVGAKPPIGTKPAQPGARPAQPGTRPVGVKPAQSGARPTQQGARPMAPRPTGAKPQSGVNRAVHKEKV